MLLNVVKIKLKEGAIEKFKELSISLVEESQKEEGCIEYHLYSDSLDQNVVCFIEKWKNQEALDLHETLPHFTNVIGDLVKLCAEPAIKNKFFIAI